MKVIAIANQKGGAGKTTTVINFGAEVSKKKRVLIIDLDPQGNCSKTLLSGNVSFDFDETIACLFDKPKVTNIEDLIRPAMSDGDEIKNLFIIPADRQLSRVIETSLTKINRERILEKQLNKIKDDYDIVLLDTPPNLSLTTLNAIQASELIIIPVDSGVYALDGIGILLDAIEEIKDDESNYVVFRNKVDGRARKTNAFLNQELQMEEIRDHVLDTQVKLVESINQAHIVNAPVSHYQPSSTSTTNYKSLAREVLSKLDM